MVIGWFRKLHGRTGSFLFCLALLCLGESSLCSEDSDIFKNRIQKAYNSAREQFATNKTSFDAAWQFARTSFDWAEFASTDPEREAVATEGVAAAHRAVELQPNSAAGHHYLAMNNGQLARTKTLGALRLVKEMEREFKKAAELDPNFDYAGPDRSLGMLYFEAPGWPTSIGSKSKARSHLRRALEVAPGYPDNHLSYMEALVTWKEKSELAEAMRKYRAILTKAKAEYTGERWEQSWSDWQKRWQKILDAFENLS
jgi:tetratricopeptide (TPR) repeat protein